MNMVKGSQKGCDEAKGLNYKVGAKGGPSFAEAFFKRKQEEKK